MNKVREYSASVYYGSTGSSSSYTYKFTQAQANEVGAILESGGLNIKSAQRLCDKWTKRGNHGDIRYTYRLIG